LGSEEVTKLIVAYQGGATVLELAERFLVSRTTVMANLNRAGSRTRYNVLEGRLDEAKLLYAQGWSLTRVAAHFDVSAGTVRNAFNRAGVATRPVGTNQWQSHP
jgi:transposase